VKFDPDWVVAPGATLQEWFDDGYVLHWPEIVQDGPRKGERIDWVARGVVPPTPYYEP
jgi:hypothetical protein